MKVVLYFDFFFSLLTGQNCMFIPLLFPAILSLLKYDHKHSIPHDQYQVTVHFSLACSPSAMQWVVKLFRTVATTEYILIAFGPFDELLSGNSLKIAVFYGKTLRTTKWRINQKNVWRSTKCFEAFVDIVVSVVSRRVFFAIHDVNDFP